MIVRAFMVGFLVWLTPVSNAAAADFGAGVFSEFTGGVTPGLSAGGGPSGAAAGPDGNVWFAEQNAPGRIARITPAGQVTELTGGVTPGLVAGARPANLTTGPDGNVWVTGFASPGRIWKVTPGGTVTEMATGGTVPEFPVDSEPTGITAGPDGNLWFTEGADPGRIGRITPEGVVSAAAIGGASEGFSANSRPRGITLGPDGNLWFAEYATDSIGRVTPDGAVSEFSLPAGAGPVDLTAGPDGNVWFTEQTAGRIGRIDPNGGTREFSGLAAGGRPTSIARGSDGNLWFTEQADPGRVGRITTSGMITEFPAGTTPGFTPNRAPTIMAAGGDGNLWFTEFAGPGGITRIAPSGTAPPGDGGGAPAGAAAPSVTAITPATALVRTRPALLSAQVSGPADRIEWDVTGDGRPDVTCDGGRSTLEFRPGGARAAARSVGFTGQVTARAIGAAGAGAPFSQALTLAPAPPLAGSRRVVRRVLAMVDHAAPVYACGDAKDLPAAAAGLTSIRNDLRDRVCLPRTVLAGTLRVEGCLRRLTSFADLPKAEQPMVSLIALALRLGSGGGGRISTEIKRAAGVAFSATDSYVAAGPVRVNGTDIEPAEGAHVVVYAQGNQIVSSDAGFSVGGIRLKAERDFSIDTQTVSNGSIPLGAFPRLPSRVKGLGDFPLTGDVAVTLEPSVDGAPAGARLRTTLELPSFLNVGGGPARAAVTLRLTGDGEFVLDDLHIGPLSGEIGSLGASDLRLDYTGATREWKGQAKLCVVVACLDAVERAGQAPPAGVVIRNGSLVRAFVNLDFPDPGVDLYPPYVKLNSIGAGLALNPTRFLGTVKTTALGIYGINGSLALAFPSTAAPYRLTREEAGNGFPTPDYDRAYTRFTLAASGEAFLKVPGLGARVHLGGAYLLYQAPGYVHVGGDVEESFYGIVKLIGRTSGELNVENGRFNFAQDIDACIADFFCRGAFTRLSSVGVGGCYRLGPISFGGGIRFSPLEVIIWPIDGCKWSRFEDPSVASGRAVVRAVPTGGTTVTIRAGDRSRAIRFDGEGGAPRVRVTGPGGQTLDSTDGAGTQLTPAIRILRSEQLKTTVVGLQDPKPGRYTIALLPGSPQVSKVTTAQDPPDARATGTVRGHGARRKLVYNVLRRPGQRVTFLESSAGGDRPIGTVTGGRGTLSFTPAPGPGTRRIVAQFELEGIGAERTVVARFRPPSARLGRPARVTVRRRGSRLRVSWPAVAGAARYDVVVTSKSGAQRAVTTRSDAASIRRVSRSSAGRVSVRATAPMRAGTPRTARYRAAGRRAPTRVRRLPRGS